VTPDGRRIVTGSLDKTARIWDAATAKEIAALRGHDGGVTSVAVTVDLTRIITGSDDDTARVWEASRAELAGEAGGAELAVLRSHGGSITSVAVTPDGSRIITGSTDNTAKIWEDFPLNQALVDQAKAVVPRCLTPSQRVQFFLDPTPPLWCIAMEKWPFDTQDWQKWHADKMAGDNPPLPYGH
jgi:WD40 repeat protein